MKVESLIFDMDGTLWDSAANVAASWSEVLERQADVDMKVTEADIKSVMGMPMDAIADKLFGAYSEDRMTQLIDACGDYENEYLREHYYGFGKYFKDILCWGDTKVSKGESIKILMEKNGIEDAAYVGDIQGDCDSARFAGIKFIHAAYGFGSVKDKDAEIHTFAELLDVVE